MEYFISWESEDEQVLFGFLRLRIPINSETHMVFPELADTALIRELHVYGRTFAVGDRPDQAKNGKSSNTPVAQHLGIGQRLLVAAENLAKYEGYERLAVISGVGVQNYYKRFGYQLAEGEGEFMIKDIHALTLYEILSQFLGSLRIW